MESCPLVTIGVPIYGVEQYIERCARSLFEQSYHNIEYIFVNDCTKDSSINVLQRVLIDYPDRVGRVKIINHMKNRGLGAARNTAVDNATGKFLMWVDSDDYIDRLTVEKILKKQKENDADIVSFDYMEFYGEKKMNACRSTSLGNRTSWKFDIISRKEPTMIWGRLIRLSLYKENHLFVEEGVNMGEDYQIIPRLFYYAVKTDELHEFLYYYNKTNVESYCSKFSEQKADQSLRSVAIVKDFFIDKGEEFRRAVSIAEAKTLAMYTRGAVHSSNKKYYSRLKKKINLIPREIVQCLKKEDRAIFLVNNYMVLKFVDFLKNAL